VDCIIFEVHGRLLPFRFDQEVIRDISAGGVGFEATQDLLPKSEVGMEFGLNYDQPFIKIKGIIVWSNQTASVVNPSKPQVVKFRMGLHFMEIAPEDKAQIQKFVEQA
jgi:c-di-GMP-binding flagellar brake protein YcgR